MSPIEEDEMEDKVPLMAGSNMGPIRSDLKEAAFEDHPDPWGKGYRQLYCICLLLYLSMSQNSAIEPAKAIPIWLTMHYDIRFHHVWL